MARWQLGLAGKSKNTNLSFSGMLKSQSGYLQTLSKTQRNLSGANNKDPIVSPVIE